MSGRSRRRRSDDDVDRAAGVLARQGLTDTSLDQVAHAVALSKTGLLSSFPTKDGLVEAAMSLLSAEVARSVQGAAGLPVGRERDLLVVQGCVDLVLRRPGLSALSQRLSLSSVANVESERQGHVLMAAFGVDDDTDPTRLASIATALTGVQGAVHAVAGADDREQWRRPIITAAMRTLGHRAIEAAPVGLRAAN